MDSYDFKLKGPKNWRLKYLLNCKEKVAKRFMKGRIAGGMTSLEGMKMNKGSHLKKP